MLTGLLQLTTLFLIPEIHHLALLIFAVFCIGCVIGVIDVGGQGSPNVDSTNTHGSLFGKDRLFGEPLQGQILILKYFKRDSPQLIQLFHFG